MRHEFAREGLVWHEPDAIDIRQLMGALKPSLPDLALETVTANLGITISNRHTAMGDCVATAQVWEKVIPMLRDTDIRTLGEVQTLARQRQDLMLRQHESGWFDEPDGLVSVRPVATARIDSYVFEHRVRDLMHSPAETIEVNASLQYAAQRMIEKQVGCLLVGETEQIPLGIITESDLMRASASGEHDFSKTPVSKIMSSPVESIDKNEMLYRALARMDRLRICHLYVTDNSGLPVGMVSQRDLLQYRARGTQMLSDALEQADDVASLAAAYSQVNTVAAQLVNEGLDGLEIARVISTELRAVTAQAARLSANQMVLDGKGEAPTDWCVLVLGSGGRGESLLIADQDNALIYTGSEEDDNWFQEFSVRMANILNEAGVPYCKGKVMASTRQWRGNQTQWNKRVDDWLRRAQPEDILNVDIFFDLVPVAGNFELARKLHKDATEVAQTSNAFTGLMAQSVQMFAPRFSMFGKLPVEDGRINLKRDGLLPLVSFARAIALRIGSTSRATPERLRDAIVAGRLAEGDTERMIDLHRLLLTCILDQQLQDIEAGLPLSSRVNAKSLSRKNYSELMKGLKHLSTMVNETQSLILG